MTVDEFVRSEDLKLPFDWFAHDPLGCGPAISGELNAYHNFLDHIDKDVDFPKNDWELGLEEVKRLAKFLQQGLDKALDLYLKEGNRYEAYNVFKSTLEEEIVFDCHKKFKVMDFLNVVRIPQISFRVRRSDEHLTESKELFHINVKDRHKVGDERYSVSGIPCLYVANSLYLSCKETGVSSFEECFASIVRYIPYLSEIEDDLRVLDLTYDQNFEDNNWKVRYMILWPLYAVCNIKVHDYNHKFRCEYIFPQMLLSWVMHDKPSLIGIKYNSTKISESQNNQGRFYNMAFPAKNGRWDGYGLLLSEHFQLSKPVRMGSSLDYDKRTFGLLHEVESYNEAGVLVDYKETDYAKIESCLRDQPVYSIRNEIYAGHDYVNLNKRRERFLNSNT